MSGAEGSGINMPIGIIVNAASVALGGFAGALAGKRLSPAIKSGLNMIFGLSAMLMGISSIVLMVNMPAVVFSLIVGTALGILVHLGSRIQRGGEAMQRAASKALRAKTGLSQEEFASALVTVIVLFCASGTGIYGSMISGMNGDHSILIAKSILDFFTAMIFACNLGAVVSFVAAPQLIIFLAIFFAAGYIFPLTTPDMISDFKACGGALILATGFRILGLKMFPVADMIPAMALVMPVSWLWTNCIMPLMG